MLLQCLGRAGRSLC